jgi:cholest-4-en-3-one 26-monooxygenase
MKHPDIDLLDLSRFQRDEQHDMFAHLRAHDPVSWHDHPKGRGFWNVVRHADVVRVSQDPLLFSSKVGGISILDLEESGLDADLDPRGFMMIYMDPPEHTRFKHMVNGGFTPTALRYVETYLRDRAALIVDRVIEDGGCDFAQDIAAELSVEGLGRLMGFPQQDLHLLKTLGDRLSISNATGMSQDATEAAWTLYNYFNELVRSPRQASGDDIVSRFVNAEIDGERLSEFEFNMFMLLLTGAGQETTRHTMSWGVRALSEHPDQIALLRERPDLMPGAVEEMLRWATAGQHFRRTATADTEIAGREIRAGDKVVLWYVSANRDEDVFVDPYAFSVIRDPNDQLSFGGRGPHLCLGAALARIELRVMLEEVLDRMPDISLAGQPELTASNFMRGIERMPVRFAPGPRKGLSVALSTNSPE